MKAKRYCELYGSLEKMEKLSAVSENIIPGSLVLDSLWPFCGYYNDIIHDSAPLYVYIAVDKAYSIFDVVRIYEKAREEVGFELDIVKASIKVCDRNFEALRLRHLTDFNQVKPVQEAFQKHGIKPFFNTCNQKDVDSHITIQKVFRLSRLTDDIFRDESEEMHSYLAIPRQLSFADFVEVTRRVKNNWFDTKFDAAVGAFLTENGVVDFLRIYSTIQEKQYLDNIHKLYLEKIKQLP